MSTASSFGELVAIARRRLGLSQRQLAKRVGVHPVTVSNWERGEKEAEPSIRQAVAEELLNGQPVNDQITATLEQFALGSDVREFRVAESDDDDRYYLPHELRIMATQFELDAVRRGATAEETAFLRAALQGPGTVRIFASRFTEQKGRLIESAREQYQVLIESLRAFLDVRINSRIPTIRPREAKLESPGIPGARTAELNPKEPKESRGH